MFANVTNLSVEHHFSDLDSSQKRRPNASFHHHTSIQLLKRNKTKIQNWYKKMNDDQKKKLWKRARKAGKQLREEHIKQQKRVHADIYESMLEKPKKRQKVLKKNHDVSEEEQIFSCYDGCFPMVFWSDSRFAEADASSGLFTICALFYWIPILMLSDVRKGAAYSKRREALLRLMFVFQCTPTPMLLFIFSIAVFDVLSNSFIGCAVHVLCHCAQTNS